MNRRDLFASIATAISLMALPFQRQLRSPVCGDVLGSPVSAKLSTNFDIAPAFISGVYGHIPCFPVETVVTVEYEKGVETWHALNVQADDIASFTMKKFLNSKFEKGSVGCAPGTIFYGKSKFRMATLVVKDDVTLSEVSSIDFAPIEKA